MSISTAPGCTRHLARAAAALALLLCAGSAAGQYITFGKNKVHYRSFEWSLLASEHFHLYYYPEEDSLARVAVAYAEQGYADLRARFVEEVPGPIPVILYSSHHDFEQTNVTPWLIPEGVGGLTESIRGRVLMPFDGSMPQFVTTLRHELVHVFQRAIASRVFAERARHRTPSPPLWFTEGLAEHWSGEWDADGDMVLRDLVLSGKLPPIERFWVYDGTYALYKLGHSVIDYIATHFGDDKPAHFYRDAWRRRSFDELFPDVLGITQEELSERWTQWVRRRYYPEVAGTQAVRDFARLVAKGPMVLKPTPLPPGAAEGDSQFVFISPQSGYLSIYQASLGGEDRGVETLIKGQRQQEYLSFHAFRSRMDVSRDGVLLFSSHSGERDQLTAFDLRRREVVGRWDFPDLAGVSSPQWDVAGRRVVFSGLTRDGYRDLYLFDTHECRRERLTHDRFADHDPALHPGGRWIAFVSDRGAPGGADERHLFLLDLETREVTPLTGGPGADMSPSWSPDGERLLFVSTRDGMRDLYLVSREGRGRRLTRAVEGLLDPRWMPSGREVLTTVYSEGRFRAAVVPVAAATSHDTLDFAVDLPRARWRWERLADSSVVRERPYQAAFALDIAQGGVAVDPSLGSGEGLQILLRDMLGNRLLFLQLGNTTISTRDFLDNFSAGVTYIDMSRRLNRGLSFFHHAGDYYDELGFPYFERRAGVSALLSYPLSRFARIETSFGAAYTEKDKPSTAVFRRGAVATHYVSWIRDTALWHATGPIDGERCHLTLGLTMNLRRPGVENVLLLADARRYLRLGPLATLAMRGQARLSGGPDPQVFLLGGSHSLRGYPWRELHGTRSLLGNVEVRFPLLRGFLIDPALIGPLGFPGVQGAIFADAGRVGYSGRSEDWLGSYGLGLRMGLGGMLVLRLDLARRTDFHDWPSEKHVEFFVGWDY